MRPNPFSSGLSELRARLRPLGRIRAPTLASSLRSIYSLHCSSFFWLNQFYVKDPKR